jgi:hypothetical protein
MRIDESVEFTFNDAQEDGQNNIYILPQYKSSVPIRDLLEAEYEEMELAAFLRKRDYNDRCRNNFWQVQKGFAEIGLHVNDYYQNN